MKANEAPEQYIPKSALLAKIDDWRHNIMMGIATIPLRGHQRADAAFEHEILGLVRDFIDTFQEEPISEEWIKKSVEIQRIFETCKENGNSLTKDEFLSEFLAKTLSRKLGINRMPECEKEECNKTYTPDPYQPDAPRYPYFEAYKEGYLGAMSIAEDILVKMFNEYDNLTKD